MKKINVKKFTITAMFIAIIMILAFTPIGYINLGFIKATIIHVPVIIGSLLLGPKIGAILGAAFGLTSIINNTISPVLLSFVFSPLIPVPGLDRGSPLALIICFIPRILIGVVPYFVYKFFKFAAGKLSRNEDGKPRFQIVFLFAAGICGALTNTLLVMHFIFFFFKEAYAQAANITVEAVYGAILGIIAMNGIPEALVAGIITAGVVRVMLRFRITD